MSGEWDGKMERRAGNDALEALVFEIRKDRQRRWIFGLTITEALAVGSVLLALVGFYVRTEFHIRRVTQLMEYLSVFTKNSDGFHSALLGVQFEQGKPYNDSYDLEAIRKQLTRNRES